MYYSLIKLSILIEISQHDIPIIQNGSQPLDIAWCLTNKLFYYNVEKIHCQNEIHMFLFFYIVDV